MAGMQPYQAVNRVFCCPYPVGVLSCENGSYTLRVNGKGIVHAVPDKAIAVLGVTSENVQLEATQRENTARITAVINAIMSLGVPKEDIRTQTYQIQPQYDFINGQQVFRGYLVTHTLQVELDNIGLTGRMIDTAVSAGANTVSGVEFTASDPAAYYRRALNAAIADASAKAAEIGAKLNVAVSPVPLRITEEAYHNGAPVPFMAVQSAGAPTPIQPGQVEITASIEAVFSYRGGCGG
jgi:uncharacterized protein YggE